MSGYHAELFSYALHLELADAGASHNLAPLRLQAYQQVYMTEFEPYLHLTFDRSKRRVNFYVWWSKGHFRIHTTRAELVELPEVEAALCGEVEFVKADDKFMRLVPHSNIHQALHQVAQSLAKLSNSA
jgi:hypothetical protein